eukprot:COSAG06_NODE_5614_length_3362_cov_6.133006_3_plen_47_part_00
MLRLRLRDYKLRLYYWVFNYCQYNLIYCYKSQLLLRVTNAFVVSLS